MPGSSRMADQLALLRTFCEAAVAGSFSEAARVLGVSRAAVSAQVARLERDTGARLLARTTRRVALTDEGRRYLEGAQRILADLDALTAETTRRAGQVTGHLTVEMPEFIGTRLVAPRLPRFLEAHPQLTLALVLNEKVDEVARADADVLVRFALPEDRRLRYRRLGAMRLVCAASPAYLRRCPAPSHPRDLPRHRTIDYVYSALGKPFDWELVREPASRLRPGPTATPARPARPVVVPAQGRLIVNNTDAGLALALAGHGILHEMDYVARPLFDSGALQRVLPGWTSPEYALHALWHPGRPVAPRITAFVDFLAETLREAAEPAMRSVTSRPLTSRPVTPRRRREA